MIILYITLFIAHSCVWPSRQFQKISLNIFGQSLNASYSEHCNEIPTIFIPPLHYVIDLWKSTLVSATSDWENPIFPQQGFISYLNNPSHWLAWENVSPNVFEKLQGPLTDSALSFSAHTVMESVIPGTRAPTVPLPRDRIILIITNRTCILFDKRTCWPKLQMMLCVHGSMRCMYHSHFCRVHSCLCFWFHMLLLVTTCPRSTLRLESVWIFRELVKTA